jgi:hypothetical protein
MKTIQLVMHDAKLSIWPNCSIVFVVLNYDNNWYLVLSLYNNGEFHRIHELAANHNKLMTQTLTMVL